MSLINTLINGGDPAVLLITVCTRLLIILVVLPIHEYAHGFAARKMGDNTAQMMGRNTLNPLAHIDIIGALLLLFVGFGWAKPVPVNPRNFKNYRKGTAITALAGPLSNMICAAIGVFAEKLFVYLTPFSIEVSYLVIFALETFIQINITLAVFNLIPVHPLDGSRIITAILPPKVSAKYYQFMSKYGQIVYIVFMVLLFSDVLDLPISIISGLMLKLINLLFFWVDLIFNLIA